RLQDDPNSQLQTTSCNDMSTFKRNLSAHGGSRRQRGAALVVGLILLMVLTVLAISGMNTSTLELQMAGNTQFSENAFQAAETGIEVALAAGVTDTSKTVSTPAPVTIESDQELTYEYAIRPIPEDEGGVVEDIIEGFS